MLERRVLLSTGIALAILLGACTDGVSWSRPERENAANILASLRSTSDAAQIANRLEPGESPERLLQALRAAHLHAARVDDTVLDKLHPQLFGKFRLDYQRALARMIRAHEHGDAEAAREAAAKIRDFMDWYRRESHTFRWWPEAQPR